MLAALDNARRELSRHLAGADPALVTSATAAELVALFAEIERLGSAGKVLYAERAAQSMVWRDQGHRSAASWMAATSGTGMGEAIGALETSAALGCLPETSEALRRGELSAPQVKVIAGAALGDPRTEAELLRSAATRSLKGLKETAAQLRAADGSAEQELARYNAIRASRRVRHWTDPDGALRLDARLTPDAGARVLSVLRPEADARFHQARKDQNPEPPAAYLADALVALVCGEPVTAKNATASPRATVSIRVDAAALRRGHVEGGETCVIPGVGPVPVAVARRQLSDATVKLLVVDAVDVLSVCHAGRTVPAHLQSALEERDPTCVVPECDVAQGLQNHHWVVDYVACKTTSLDNVARVCGWHHDLISYEGYVLSGGPGAWEMRAPPGGASFETGTPFETGPPGEIGTRSDAGGASGTEPLFETVPPSDTG